MFYLGREGNSPTTLWTFQQLHFVVVLQQLFDVNHTATWKLDKVTLGLEVGGSLAPETETTFSTAGVTEMTTGKLLITFLLAPRPGALRAALPGTFPVFTPPATFLPTPGAVLATLCPTLSMRTTQGTSLAAGRTEGATDCSTGVATHQSSAAGRLAGLVEATAGAVRAGPGAAMGTGEQGSTGLGAGGDLSLSPTEDPGLVRTEGGLAGGHQVGAGRERIATQPGTGRVTAGQDSVVQPDLAGTAVLRTQRPTGVAALQHSGTFLEEGKD